MGKVFFQILKAQFAIILMAAIVAASYYGCETFDLIADSGALLTSEAIMEEVLGQLPTIGNWLQNMFNLQKAFDGHSMLQTTVYAEVAYALILFFVYKVMFGLQKLTDNLFSEIADDQGIVGWLCKFCSMMAVVFFSVAETNLINLQMKRVLSFLDPMGSTVALYAIILLIIAIWFMIGKRQAALSAAINAMFEMVQGFVIVCLIYLSAALTQMMENNVYLLPKERIAVIIGEILCILMLTILGAQSFAAGIGKWFGSK